jgi:hypothetical protein
MKYNHIFLATIAILSLTLNSDIKIAHADLAHGTDLQIHRSIDNDAEETIALDRWQSSLSAGMLIKKMNILAH